METGDGGGWHNTQKMVAIVIGGLAGLFLGIVFLLVLKSAFKKKRTNTVIVMDMILGSIIFSGCTVACVGSIVGLNNEQRSANADYFRVYKGNNNSKSKVSLVGLALHPFLV
ncbi:hypothetical protein L2E82_43602 [Cichorium intybus]|uniref:Uncharacterized protein n=1 Tax=Cichorium intybus TaxID=13427 RepID=A0ACB8ZNR8_CICIN|nr:hypothetical protein L2E82_43602 [Cichorium intybus]